MARKKGFWKKVKEHFKEVIETDASPHAIALGFALGTAIAVFPTFGLGIFIGILLVFIFKKINKPSLFLSFVFWNPILLFFVYSFSFHLGDVLFSNLPVINLKFEILNWIFIYSRRFLIGNLIVMAVLSSLSYFFVFSFAKWYYRKKRKIHKVVEGVIEKVGLEDIKEKV